MVTITKPPKRSNAILYKKTAAFVALLILLWIGYHWLSLFHVWFITSISSSKNSLRTTTNNNNNGLSATQQQQQQQQQSGSKGQRKEEQPLPKIKGVSQPKISYEQRSKAILSKLHQLTSSVPLAPPSQQNNNNNNSNNSNNSIESKFLTVANKECLPGRDDTNGEINPTTHRKRECLRHVPLGKKGGHHKIEDGFELEERMKYQKPRIGIMIPPGFIGQSFANWVSSAIQQTGDAIHMDVEILNTSHVPVYGYGKSHGYTKLIRLLTLPLPLAAYDAYLYASSILVEENEYYKNVLKDIVDEMKLGRKLVPPSEESLGKILQLILRWHCRLSHVSAHTAMLTLQLEDIIKAPTAVLSSILSFIWREDWEWEGHGGKHHQGTPQSGGWNGEAEEFITKDDDHGNLLQTLLEQTSILLDEVISSASGGTDMDNGSNNNNAFKKSIQGAFASEMQRSQDMTSWPCPSFWEGVDSSSSSTTTTLADDGEDGNHQLMRVLQQISGEMVPDCREDDPFIRCTVNKDKCEVKRDAKC